MTTSPSTSSDTSDTTTSKRELDLAQRLALGTRLTELREARGLTQLKVAQEALGFSVSHAAVSRLERGVFGVVDNAKLDKLAAFYGTTIDALLAEMEGRREEEEPEEFRSTDCLDVQPGLGSRLYNMRQAAGLTKAALALKLGYHESAQSLIHQWEKGEVTPKPDTLLDVAIKMNISAAWLITGKRAKPSTPTFPMRLRAVQKLYSLTNRETALLADMDLESGRATIARLTRGHRPPTAEQVIAVARALDVPVEWICPPEAGYQPVKPAEGSGILEGLTPKAAAFMGELAALFANGALEDEDINQLRSDFMKKLMKSLRKAA